MANDLVALKLERIQGKVEKAKFERSRLEGKKEMILASIKKNFDVDTVEEAEEILVQMNKDLDETHTKLSVVVKEMDAIVDGV